MVRITIDREKCVTCGDCAVICPVLVYGRNFPPCQTACPLGTDVQGYLSLIAQGRFNDAFEVVRDANPLPLSTGRVCSRPCESRCLRGDFDEPLAICNLKRFVGDYVHDHKMASFSRASRREKVAIVGGGPAGLTAACDLALRGYPVTVFEALPEAGGMLFAGIPEYRLPKSLLRADIENIRALGVDIRNNIRIGRDMSIDDLLRQEYRAILLAIGAWKGLKLNIPGENSEGVVDAIEFLKNVNLGKLRSLGGKVVVVGGGNSAIDSARSALRLGAQSVTLVYRRSREEMPAIASEIEEVEQEGVKFEYRVAPSVVIVESGKVSALQCLRTRPGRADGGGKQPGVLPGSEFLIEANFVITAVSQKPDIDALRFKGLVTNEAGNLVANPETLGGGRAELFAAGDAVTGPATMVEAMAAGKRAAAAIVAHLENGTIASEPLAEIPLPDKERIRQTLVGVTTQRRLPMPKPPLEERTVSFSEVEQGYNEEAAVKEARRCLGCGYFSDVDEASCCGLSCRICVRNCWQKAIQVNP